MSHVDEVDYVIVGAGPAGLQLAYYFQQAGMSYVVLERSTKPGHAFTIFPRHRKLISINKVHTGYRDKEVNYRHDWNSLLCDDEQLLFKNYSREYFPNADTYVRYLSDFATRHALDIRYEQAVETITKQGDGRFLVTASETIRCAKLIICTGLSKPHIPDIPGIDLTEQYQSMSIDPERFTDKAVLVIGKGNSGFETADNLIAHASTIHIVSPTPLRMAWKTHYVGNLRAVNNNFLDSYQLKSQNAVLDARIAEIRRKDDRYHVVLDYRQADERETLVYDHVLCCTGFAFDSSIFSDDCQPSLVIDDRFPQLTNEWESVNVEGLYFAGTITQSLDYKRSTSGFIHGFRYGAKSLFRLLQARANDESLLTSIEARTPKQLTDFLIGRVNRTSALWQQNGFLADAIVLEPFDTYHLYEMPVGYVKQEIAMKHSDVLMLTMEYGPQQDNPFDAKRVNPGDQRNADQSSFLHPVIRHFVDGVQTSEHHVIENLAGEWLGDEHVLPLLAYLKSIRRPAPLSVAANT